MIGAAIAAGVVFLGGLSLVTLAVAGIVHTYLGLTRKMLGYKTEDIKKSAEIMCLTFDALFDVIAAAAPNPIQLIQAAAATGFATTATGVFYMLSLVTSKMKKMVEDVTPEVMQSFSKLIIGKDDKDTNSVLGSINAIIGAFSKIDGVAKALVISLALKPII